MAFIGVISREGLSSLQNGLYVFNSLYSLIVAMYFFSLLILFLARQIEN